MKRRIFTLDEESCKVLDEKVNASDFVRNAIRVYNDDILTGMGEKLVVGMRVLVKENREMKDRFIEQYEIVEDLRNLVKEAMGR